MPLSKETKSNQTKISDWYIVMCLVDWLCQKKSNNAEPSQLGLENTLTTSLQKSKTPPMSVLDMA